MTRVWRTPSITSPAWAPSLVGIGVLALGALRAGDQGFHLDEAHTAVSAGLPWRELVGQLDDEAGMAPYYLALWLWRHAGDSEQWLRMLSVCGGALAAALLVVIARRITTPAIAAIATFALVCNPFFLRNLTELRGYSWTMALALLATLLAWRLTDDPTIGNGVRHGATIGVLLALLSFAAGVVVAQLVALRSLARDARTRRALVVSAAIAAVIVVPTLPALLTSNQVDWIEPTTPYKVASQTAIALGGPVWAMAIGLGVVCLLVALVRGHLPNHEPEIRLIISTVVLMPGVLLLASLAKPLYEARYLAPGLPFAVLAATTGAVTLGQRAISDTRHRQLAAGALVLACAIGFPGRPDHDAERHEDQQLAAQALRAGLEDGDALVYAPGWLEYSMRYSLGDTPVTGFLDPGVDPRWARPTPTDRPLTEFCRVWVLRRPGPEATPLADELLASVDPADPVAGTDIVGGYELTLVKQC